MQAPASQAAQDSPTFSIVIPAFNCAEWLVRSVTSAFGFTNAATEVIVVDDGSTDTTPIVLEGLRHSHPSLKVLSGSNRGLSAARNTGIGAARGTYIVLLDADDELVGMPALADWLEGADMLRIGVEEVEVDGKQILHTEAVGLRQGIDYLAEAMRRKHLYPTSWSYVYKRSFLHDAALAFMPGLLHEDMLFTVEALLAAPRFKALPAIGYRYIRRAGSLTVPTDPDRLMLRLNSLGAIERRMTAYANHHAEVDLGWWSLNILNYAHSLADESCSRGARWLVFWMHCGFFMRYRRWGRYRRLRDERYRLSRSLKAVVR
jgi:glycosyltransferase involved in cell wall biosynthesis